MFDIDPNVTIGFTGHRPGSLPWKYDESKASCKAFKDDLLVMLEKAINAGWTSFISGLAIGFDTIAAETVLSLKKKYKNVRLYGAIPHPGQEARWSDADKSRYHKLIKKLDGYEVCSDSYAGAETMYKRNRFIVDHSSVIIALWNGKPSGTSNTVNYAKSKGKKVRVINPNDYVNIDLQPDIMERLTRDVCRNKNDYDISSDQFLVEDTIFNIALKVKYVPYTLTEDDKAYISSEILKCKTIDKVRKFADKYAKIIQKKHK